MAPTKRLGRYLLGKRIGEGGMGEVFFAEVEGAEGFSKTFAIKRLRSSLPRDPELTKAIVHEARLAKRLHHGNIVQIHDLGVEDERPYLVLEYVNGVSLREILQSREHAGGMPAEDVFYLVEQVAAALEYAHELADDADRPTGVVHRDVKPANILVSRDGLVKLTDFGIAKALDRPSHTLPGMVKGTMGYLSPEQAKGAEVDEKTDQFALGVMLYELLAGHNPLAETESLAEYLALLEQGIPRMVAEDPVDDELVEVVMRAVAPEPADRFASVADFRAALERWRVSRGLRAGSDRLRAIVRELGVDAPGRSRKRLDDVVGAQLQRIESARTIRAEAGPKSGRAWRPIAVGAAMLGAAVAVLVLVRSRSAQQGDGRPAVSAPTSVPASVEVADSGMTAAGAAAALDVSAAAEPAESDASVAPTEPRAISDRRASPSPPAARAPPGVLKVNVLPWANVFVDGEEKGATPLRLELSPGKHEIRLENPNRQPRSKTVTIESGKVRAVTSW